MNLKKFILVLTIITILPVIVVFTLFLFERNSKVAQSKNIISTNIDVKPEVPASIEKTELVVITPTIEFKKPIFGGWIPTWASDSGLSTLKNNENKFQEISPVWYEVKTNGDLNPKYPKNRNEIIEYAKKNDIKIVPTVGMFDHELFHTILSRNLDNHVNSIVNYVLKNSYDGIDLDYESISLKDYDNYYIFLDKLSRSLRAQDKVLYVTVLAKWGDDVNYSYRPETRKVQEWNEISKYADKIRIMAYDYTYSGDYFPGPIGPISWIGKILNYASIKIPAEKTVLGIHLYAYEWYIPASEGELTLIPDSLTNKQNNPRIARAYTYSNVQNILSKNKGEILELEGEKIFVYQATNSKTSVLENRTLVFMDQEGIEKRTNLAKEYGVNQFVFWRLGGEGDIRF